MRHMFALAVILSASAAQAQDMPGPPPMPAPIPAPVPETPPALIDQIEELLNRFLDRVAPPVEQGLTALEPDMRALLDRMRGMVQYEAPEVLPNGDILIRRKVPLDAPAQPPSADGPERGAPAGDAPAVTPFEL